MSEDSSRLLTMSPAHQKETYATTRPLKVGFIVTIFCWANNSVLLGPALNLPTKDLKSLENFTPDGKYSPIDAKKIQAKKSRTGSMNADAWNEKDIEMLLIPADEKQTTVAFRVVWKHRKPEGVNRCLFMITWSSCSENKTNSYQRLVYLSDTIIMIIFLVSLYQLFSDASETVVRYFVFCAMGNYTLLSFKELQSKTELIRMTGRYMRGWQLTYWLPIAQAHFI